MRGLTAALVALIAILSASAAAQDGVVDHYRALVRDLGKDTLWGYALSRQRGRWTAKNEDSNITGTVVDPANGYISINDEGTGGGNVVMEIALFRIGREPLLIRSSTFFHGIEPTSGEIAAYRKRDGKWTDVTAEHLPALGMGEFLEPAREIVRDDNDPPLPIVWRLPRKGTGINVYMVGRDAEMCADRNWLSIAEEAQRKAACDVAMRDSLSRIELTFDRASGRFTPGRRDRQKAPGLRPN